MPKVIFLLGTVVNLFIALSGLNFFTSFVVGEIIIVLFIVDFMRQQLLFHLYQILLLYFYFSLVLVHSFIPLDSAVYLTAYFINLFHFLFFAMGYHIKGYADFQKPVAPKQSPIIFSYLIISLVATVYLLMTNDIALTYSDNFRSFEDTRDLPFFKIYLGIIFSYIKSIIIYTFSNPVLLATVTFISNILSYPLHGIKGTVLSSFLLLLVLFQIFIHRFTVKSIPFIFFISAVFIFILIGSTAFRGDLSLESIFVVLSDIDILIDSWRYFVLESPEASHVRYTSQLITFLDDGLTEFRFGFDYYRFFFYPVKWAWLNYEFASYNQFLMLLSGRQLSAGLYLGLAGELFWNFGWVFPLFSFAYGYGLRSFSNYSFSGSYFRLAIYCLAYKSILWHLYRGEANAFVIMISGFLLAIFTLHCLMRFSFAKKFFKFLSKGSCNISLRGRGAKTKHE